MPFNRVALATVLGLLACWPALAVPGRSAEPPGPDDEVLDMVIQLLEDPDRDMRAVALDQVRSDLPGQTATKRLAALLPRLALAARAELLEALGERGDRAARPAVLAAAEDPDAAVRAAALAALGGLGEADDVPLLAERAAGGSPREREAAQRSLAQLRGEGVNQAMTTAVAARSEPAVRAVLLEALADRNAVEAAPAVLPCAGDASLAVRLAAYDALRRLAPPDMASEVAAVVRQAADGEERWRAELALLALCSRAGPQAAGDVIAQLEGAGREARKALLRALGRAGGAQALAAVALRTENDPDGQVRDEAMRVLSCWPDAAAAPFLERALHRPAPPRRRALAFRGLVRLLTEGEGPLEADRVRRLMAAARDDAERRLLLGALCRKPDPELASTAAALLDNAPVADEAAMAILRIAEAAREAGRGDDTLARLVQRIADETSHPRVRERAKRWLEGS